MSTVEISILYLLSIWKLHFVEWSWRFHVKYTVSFSDAFDLQYGVGVLRMRERLDVSHPSQSHGERFIIWLFVVEEAISTYASSVDVLKWTHVINFSVRVSVNAGFDGRPENINTISALPRLKTSTTCMCNDSSNQLIFYIFKNDLWTCPEIQLDGKCDWLTDWLTWTYQSLRTVSWTSKNK